jgi:putative tricarboxylic transport membrane protein
MRSGTLPTMLLQRIRAHRAGGSKSDYYAGGLIALIGAGAVLQGQTYPIGTMMRIGPGFFPVVLGCVLALVGILIAVIPAEAQQGGEHETVPAFDFRGTACITGGVLLFIVIGKFAGLVPATLASVFLSAIGDRTTTVRQALLLAVIMTIIGVLLFVYGLSIQFPLLSW